MVALGPEFENVIRQVSTWSDGARLALARRLLESLDPSADSKRRRGLSAAEAAALTNSRQPAPDDETVRRWADEHY